MVVAYIDNMESKIINIYFDQNAYPFKDKERSVIYPITGSAFVGFNATQKIRFFVDRIGGVLDTTWVATTKLPNGQLIYELLQTTNYDSEVGEYYVELTLTQPYSALKGEISIGLAGYQGGVEVQEDEDTGIYTIVGTPTIQTSAVVKFNINYAPSTLPRQTLGFTDLQQVLAYMSNFVKQEDSVVVIEEITPDLDLSGFEEGQVFYNKDDQLFYTLDNGSLVADKNGYVPYTGATKNVDLGNHTITALRFISGDGSETTYRERNLLYITHGAYSNTYTFRVKNANTNDYVATEDYVDNNIYEMASASVVLSDSDYAYLLKNNVRIHYENLYYEKAQEDANKVLFYSVDYQRTTPSGYTQRTTKKITLTKSLQQLDAADILDNSYNKAQADKEFAHNLVVSLNTTNYKLSVYLYSKDNTTLASQTIDLPLESIVVSATYYDSYTYDGTTYTKVIVIVLATTDVPTIIPVGDLVDGLATTTQLTNGLALKIDKTSIADNLTTNDATKVLSAKQGYELNNAVVHNTGNETIAGNKSFTGSTSFKYEINFTSPDGTKSGAFRLADNGNFIWRVGNASKLMYDYANGNLSTWVDIVGNGDNAQSLGNSSHYWKDIYLKGKWKDGTNEKSLQDLLDENAELNAKLNKLQEEFNETTVDVKTYTYNYLLTSAIPSAIDSQPVIESAGMDCVGIEGNSYVYNQKVQNGNFTSTSYWNAAYGSLTVSNNVGTYKLNEERNAQRLETTSYMTMVANHKYLGMFYVNNKYSDSAIKIVVRGQNTSSALFFKENIAFNTKTLVAGIFTNPYDSNVLRYYTQKNDDTNLPVNAEVEFSQIQLFDLTQLGLDSATTTDEAIAGLMQLGINPYEYNPYNEGEIIDSKPTKLVSGGFNVWDEQVESGSLSTIGTESVYANRLRTKNYIPVLPNTSYYKKTPLSFARLCCYDKNKQFIQTEQSTANASFTTPANCYFIRFATPDAYGTTYNNDICINVSNATLNGTYRPYIAPNEYALDVPVLRSANTAHDITVANGTTTRNIYEIDLGNLQWGLGGTDGDVFTANFGTNPAPYIQSQDNLHVATNILNVKYDVKSYAQLNSSKVVGIAIRGSDKTVRIYDNSYATLDAFTNAISGQKLYYQVETPTTESGTSLPENIAIQKGGTITAEYDGTSKAPSDFEFDIATSKIV